MSEQREGIFNVYVQHAERHIDRHVKAGTTRLISRERVEQQILETLQDYHFPADTKISWIYAVLATPLFETLWRSASVRNNLTPAQTLRFVPAESLYEYTIPPEIQHQLETQEAAKRTHKIKTAKKQTKKKQVSEAEAEASDSSTTSAERAYAMALYHGIDESAPHPITGELDPFLYPDASGTAAGNGNGNGNGKGDVVPLLDANGLKRQTGDDGAWGSSKAAKKGGGKGKGKGKKVSFENGASVSPSASTGAGGGGGAQTNVMVE